MNRDDLAEAVVPLAQRLVGAVHDDGPLEVEDAITAVEALGSIDGLRALAVVLAAMVDPDKTARELLGWVEETYVQDSMFPTAVGSTDPRTWPDHLCHLHWMAYRRVASAHTPMERAGYKEWERRRAILRRGIEWETRAIHSGVGASETPGQEALDGK